MVKQEVNATVILFLMIILIPLSGMGVDIYSPSLPHIAKYFDSPTSLVKLTITTYTLGYGLGQLFFGTLTDTHGRRKIVLISTFFYLIVTYAATLSPNVYVLLSLRLLQGILIAASGVVAKILVTDCFTDKQRAIAANWITIAWAMGPIVAPVIGGYLQSYFDWHYPLYFLILYGTILFLLCFFFLPETLKTKTPINFKGILHNYRVILSNKLFLGGLISCAIFAGIIYIFNVIGPFLIQDILGYSPIAFGHFALLTGLAWLLGNFSNRVLLKYFFQHQLIGVGALFSFIISIIMLALALIGYINIYSILIPIIGILFFGAIIFSNSMGICLSLFPQMAGTAAAIMGSFFVVGASLTTIIASFLKSQTQVPLSIIYFVLLAIGLFIALSLLNSHNLKSQKIN